MVVLVVVGVAVQFILCLIQLPADQFQGGACCQQKLQVVLVQRVDIGFTVETAIHDHVQAAIPQCFQVRQQCLQGNYVRNIPG